MTGKRLGRVRGSGSGRFATLVVAVLTPAVLAAGVAALRFAGLATPSSRASHETSIAAKQPVEEMPVSAAPAVPGPDSAFPPQYVPPMPVLEARPEFVYEGFIEPTGKVGDAVESRDVDDVRDLRDVGKSRGVRDGGKAGDIRDVQDVRPKSRRGTVNGTRDDRPPRAVEEAPPSTSSPQPPAPPPTPPPAQQWDCPEEWRGTWLWEVCQERAGRSNSPQESP